ncbi:hypothetical protein CGZ93_11415 [Enemella dayhoffiae]|uniref:Carboxypeptidase regulatory-like domain-containing protein n=1 Tax=Enemella dayhoffiae TaxID=2016507 RepID=A0A255GZM7_9ACTN|nr:carboxypeptidase-like regulatory domain-containing protein [Enemella dayhoffiae]OYO20832.1 hypothetical protein CGZ93_11415 [Enemella dayhoffiae]
MNGKQRVVTALVATAAIGIGPAVWFAGNAVAAPSADSRRLCSQHCSISSPFSAATEGVTEGGNVQVQVQGKPGSYKVRVFQVVTNAEGRPTKLVPVGPVTTVEVEPNGYAKPTPVKIDPIKAPLTGGSKRFTVQPADATDVNQLVGSGKSVDQFTVNSHRARVARTSLGPRDGKAYQNGEASTYALEAGIPGDRYEVHVKNKAGKWVKVSTDTKDAGMARPNGEIGPKHDGLITFDPRRAQLAPGKYQLRVVNAKDPANPIFTTEVTILGNGETPTTTPPPSTPSVSPAPSTAAPRTSTLFVGPGVREPLQWKREGDSIVVRGRLVNGADGPVGGVEVELVSGDQRVKVKPDRDGGFTARMKVADKDSRFRVVFAGAKQLKPSESATVDAAGKEIQPTPAKATKFTGSNGSGGPAWVRINAEPRVTVNGVLVGENGKPVPNAEVRVVRMKSDPKEITKPEVIVTVRTDKDGRFSASADLPKGWQDTAQPVAVNFPGNGELRSTTSEAVDPRKMQVGGPEPSPTPPPSSSPTPSPTPSPTATPRVDQRTETRLVGPDGTGAPSYRIENGRMISTGRLVTADGKPVAGAKLTNNDVTGGQNGPVLGETTTGADGSFTLTAALPEGWETRSNFNVALRFAGDDTHRPIEVQTRPEAGGTGAGGGSGSGAGSGSGSGGTDGGSSDGGTTGGGTSPDAKGAPESSGGLAKTGA